MWEAVTLALVVSAIAILMSIISVSIAIMWKASHISRLFRIWLKKRHSILHDEGFNWFEDHRLSLSEPDAVQIDSDLKMFCWTLSSSERKIFLSYVENNEEKGEYYKDIYRRVLASSLQADHYSGVTKSELSEDSAEWDALLANKFGQPQDGNGKSALSMNRMTRRMLAKRCFDIVASLSMLMLVAPLMIIIASMIYLLDGSPVIFRQRRFGRFGKLYYVLHFRTMKSSAEDGDPRLTRLGRILRKADLDKLPQLFNVIRGDMSLVGPHPLLVDEVARIMKIAPEWLLIRPGMISLDEVIPKASKRKFGAFVSNRWYVRKASFSLDLWVLFRFMLIVFSGRSGRVVPRSYHHELPERTAGAAASRRLSVSRWLGGDDSHLRDAA